MSTRQRGSIQPVLLAVATVVALVVLGWILERFDLLDLGNDGGSNPSPSVRVTGDPALIAQAREALPSVKIKAKGTKDGYSRDQFGVAWADVDKNGCDTRNDILGRDLTDTTLAKNKCTVLAGTLLDPYTGKTITFTRGSGTSAEVQIDHVVALSNAWQTGARSWKDAKRLAIANDPDNLLAVDGPTNAAKSDKDASDWLPPNTAYQCDYVARQTLVKSKYGLWMTKAEHDTIDQLLTSCAE